MEKEDIKNVLENWKSVRKLTLDLLDIIPENKLGFTVGENMGTLGKQYRHIGDVQLCYVDAIKVGKISFDEYKKDYSIEKSKEKLKAFLLELDEEIIVLAQNNLNVEIDWFGEKWNLVQHFRALIEHEILHQGELVVYIRTMELPFPKSWEMWGLYK